MDNEWEGGRMEEGRDVLISERNFTFFKGFLVFRPVSHANPTLSNTNLDLPNGSPSGAKCL